MPADVVTKIDNTVPVAEFGGTVGRRWGAILSGRYDSNGRGSDDIQPVPTIAAGTALTPAFSSIDLRMNDNSASV